jgi:glycosyltransferase involved in cell wall biosynthesis
MTVYNTERYVAAAVESILSQKHSDFEFVIVDDGSTDRSLPILQEFAARDDRIRLVNRPNTGISQARNDALALARGELLAIMDADDIALPTRLATQVEYLQTHERVVCAGAWFEVIDSAERLLAQLTPPPGNAQIQECLLRGHTSICQPSAMLRRQAVEKVGGFDNDLAPSEDLDLCLRLGEIGELANIPKVLLRYRVHGESASSTARRRQWISARTACERAWKRRGIQGGRFEPESPWRPDGSRVSRHEWALKCGWWAFGSGQRRTALLYGLKAVAALPHRSDGWRLAACSVLKPKVG